MLERATPCLDPAVVCLFRRLEAPTRSRRALDAAFWRNRGDDIGVPPWWPAYLRSLRKNGPSRAQDHTPTTGFDKSYIPSSGGASPHVNGFRDPGFPLYPTSFRSFSTSPPIDQQAALELRRESLEENTDAHAAENPYTPERQHEVTQHQDADASEPGASAADGKSEHSPMPSITTQMTRLRSILESGDHERSGEAWRIFVSSRTSPSLTRHLIQFLCSSRRSSDAEHALTAYQSLPRNERTSSTYAVAVQTATKLRSHSKAKSINQEAIARGMGYNSSQFLLAYYVRHGYWKSAAGLWAVLNEFADIPSPSSKPAPKSNAAAEENLFQKSERLWSGIDHMINLPEKVLSIGRRLRSRDPVLLLDEAKIRRLANVLLHRVLHSPKIMGLITAKGFLSICRIYGELGILSVLHFRSGLNTLRGMRDSRNRSHLAVLIYRHMKFKFPGASVPRYVLGTMISICCDAELPADAYDVFLEDFAKRYGKPDQVAYQKVLTACARQGDVAAVDRLFGKLCADHGSPTDIAFLTPLLYVHASTGDVERTKAQFDRLHPIFGVRPNVYCWNILLQAHCRANDGDGAFKVFQDMLKQGLTPDAYSFGTLMGLCSNNGDIEAVHSLIELARKHQVPATGPILDTVVHAYCLNDEVDRAESLVEQATKMNLEGSTTRMWNILLRHYAFRADSTSLLRIQERMREASVKPDSMTYGALMSALVILGRTKDAAKILRSLHFSQNLTATLFHYSIVLHGFVQEGDRDMATIIFNEIRERFPRVSASARLAMLCVQSKRDLDTYKQRKSKQGDFGEVLTQPHALDALAEALLETSSADLASKAPQPGFHRRRPVAAVSSIYMEFLIASYNQHGSFKRAETLLARHQSVSKSANLSRGRGNESDVELLTLYMTGCAHHQQWKLVDQAWQDILSQVTSTAQSFQHDVKKLKMKADVPIRHPETFAIDYITERINNSNPTFRSMIPNADTQKLSIEPSSPILYSRRHSLSMPLNKYMHALAAQKRTTDIISLVGRLENRGFALTSKNWNTYVQVLTTSSDPSHQLLAFQTFEQKFLANTPPWRVLSKGKWIDTSQLTKDKTYFDLLPLSRSKSEKLDPSQMIPSYYTAVHLAAALMRLQKRGESGQDRNPGDVRRVARGTFNLIKKMPYLKDRIQGILLRGREVTGDPPKRPRQPTKTDRAGLLGSKSPLDHIAVENLEALSQDLSTRFDAKLSDQGPVQIGRLLSKARPRLEDPHTLRQAERITGPVFRSEASLLSHRRSEKEIEKVKRISNEERGKLAILDQIVEDAQKELMVSDDTFGEPHIDADLPFFHKDEKRSRRGDRKLPAGSQLLDPFSSYIEGVSAIQDREGQTKLDTAAEILHESGKRQAPASRDAKKDLDPSRPKRILALPSYVDKQSTPARKLNYWRDRLFLHRQPRNPGAGTLRCRPASGEVPKRDPVRQIASLENRAFQGPPLRTPAEVHRIRLPRKYTRRSERAFTRAKAGRARRRETMLGSPEIQRRTSRWSRLTAKKRQRQEKIAAGLWEANNPLRVQISNSPTLRCRRCGKLGHFSRECTDLNPLAPEEQERRRKALLRTCWRCGKQGHHPHECTDPNPLSLMEQRQAKKANRALNKENRKARRGEREKTSTNDTADSANSDAAMDEPKQLPSSEV